MFISQLYEGSISDKQIVERSGFLEILRQKVISGEIKKGDSIMADMGFDIQNDLKKLDLKLNIPPYLKDKVGFEEDDVIKTQTVARRRIHVERAICKIRRFRIFHSIIPVTKFGSITESDMVSGMPSLQFPEPSTCLTQTNTEGTSENQSK